MANFIPAHCENCGANTDDGDLYAIKSVAAIKGIEVRGSGVVTETLILTWPDSPDARGPLIYCDSCDAIVKLISNEDDEDDEDDDD